MPPRKEGSACGKPNQWSPSSATAPAEVCIRPIHLIFRACSLLITLLTSLPARKQPIKLTPAEQSYIERGEALSKEIDSIIQKSSEKETMLVTARRSRCLSTTAQALKEARREVRKSGLYDWQPSTSFSIGSQHGGLSSSIGFLSASPRFLFYSHFIFSFKG